MNGHSGAGRPFAARGPFRSILLVMVLAAAACTGRQNTPSPSAPTVNEMARALGSDVVLSLARGYSPGRSGEILLVPRPYSVLGQWNDGLRGPDDPRTTHASPWAYHQRVPIILYGPGYVRSGVRSDRPVDLADLAPTFGELLGLPFNGGDGEVLRESLSPTPDRAPPRVVVLVAYDGGGWNVLERWPHAWPVQRHLAEEGTVYLNATVGSSPSLTAPAHATMGTGVYPRTHGLVENTARLPDGTVGEVYMHRADPSLLRGETLADAWDRANENRPWVGLLGFESWHLGMMGAGASGPSGDRDVALLWDRDAYSYWTNTSAYRLPAYLPGRGRFDTHLGALDASDGARDGYWLDNDLGGGDTYILAGTPAFVDLQSDALAALLEHEPIGRDAVTDLLYVELKSTDYAGHVWNMLSIEEREVLEAQDSALGELLAALDAEVGAGRWVVGVTADHGQSPAPNAVGGMRIDRTRLFEDLKDRFGADVIEALHPSELYLDMEAARSAGIRVEDVARFVADYRYEDTVPEGIDLDGVPASLLRSRVFAGALPGSYVGSLSEADILALGPGEYEEGDLTTPPVISALGG